MNEPLYHETSMILAHSISILGEIVLLKFEVKGDHDLGKILIELGFKKLSIAGQTHTYNLLFGYLTKYLLLQRH